MMLDSVLLVFPKGNGSDLDYDIEVNKRLLHWDFCQVEIPLGIRMVVLMIYGFINGIRGQFLK